MAQGFAEWPLSDDPSVRWLRRHAELLIVPIMGVGNTATGNGGKNALPHDHNRDWSSKPHWNEVQAATRRIEDLILAERMSVFQDLHNPLPGDPTFFSILPRDLMQEPMRDLCDRFVDLACKKFQQIRPRIPVNDSPGSFNASISRTDTDGRLVHL